MMPALFVLNFLALALTSNASSESAMPPLAFDKMFQGGAVLQRGAYTPVWGTASSSINTVALSCGREPVIVAAVNASGMWFATLPPHAAEYNITLSVKDASNDDGPPVTVVVSFGEVVLCAGQSNMGMQVGPSNRGFDADNSTAESAAAGRYSGRIQLREMGGDRNPNASAWFTVTPDSIKNFSAVCWLTGRDLFGQMGEQVPVGLILSAVGAHPIESWLGPDQLAACNASTPCIDQMPESKIWGGQIVPAQPFKIGFMLWDQGEADVKCKSTAAKEERIAKYPCMQEQLVKSYREQFNSSFGFAGVQLPGYSLVQQQGIFAMRLQQDAGSHFFADSTVAIVPTYDLSCEGDKMHGCPHGNVHNVHKEPIAWRLADQVRKIHLGETKLVVHGPRVARISAENIGGDKFVVSMSFVGGTTPFYMNATRNCTVCCSTELADVGDFDVSVDGTSWINGSMPVVEKSNAVKFFVGSSAAPMWVRYTANRAFPQCALYNQEGYPAFPFQQRVGVDTDAIVV